MPDLSPLPPLGESPRFVPDESRFARAVRTAHRRRVQRSTGMLGAGVVTAAGLGLAGRGTPDASRLTPATDPTASIHATVGPVEIGVVVGSRSPSPEPSPSEELSPEPEPEASETPDPEASGEPTPGATPTAGKPRPMPWTPVHATRSDVAYDAALPCAESAADAQEGWCARALGETEAGAGEENELVFELCRPATAGTMTFADVNEVTASVTDADGVEVRELAVVVRTTGPHSVVVAGGRCARWTGDWIVNDNRGLPLDPGEYDLNWIDRGRGRSSGPAYSYRITVS